ncbi:hypothetical protein DFJ74DRAFT_718859 [Hyaloraphidium curvatum]|nr:hypothetical protein DFJ74DRAFT_718859 [Hyaloraphidium curvatum]
MQFAPHSSLSVLYGFRAESRPLCVRLKLLSDLTPQIAVLRLGQRSGKGPLGKLSPDIIDNIVDHLLDAAQRDAFPDESDLWTEHLPKKWDPDRYGSEDKLDAFIGSRFGVGVRRMFSDIEPFGMWLVTLPRHANYGTWAEGTGYSDPQAYVVGFPEGYFDVSPEEEARLRTCARRLRAPALEIDGNGRVETRPGWAEPGWWMLLSNSVGPIDGEDEEGEEEGGREGESAGGDGDGSTGEGTTDDDDSWYTTDGSEGDEVEERTEGKAGGDQA